MQVKTFLPIFPGFYNTVFDPESGLNNYEFNEGLTYEQYDFDNTGYQNEIADSACSAVETYLQGAGVASRVTFESVWSPKEYNFKNDSINCTIEVDIKAVEAYVTTHAEAFAAYLKENFTSCSGFISFQSNQLSDWMEYLQSLPVDDDMQKVGHVLDFIVRHWLEEVEFIKPEDQQAKLYDDSNTGNGEEPMFFCTPKETENSDTE